MVSRTVQWLTVLLMFPAGILVGKYNDPIGLAITGTSLIWAPILLFDRNSGSKDILNMTVKDILDSKYIQYPLAFTTIFLGFFYIDYTEVGRAASEGAAEVIPYSTYFIHTWPGWVIVAIGFLWIGLLLSYKTEKTKTATQHRRVNR